MRSGTGQPEAGSRVAGVAPSRCDCPPARRPRAERRHDAKTATAAAERPPAAPAVPGNHGMTHGRHGIRSRPPRRHRQCCRQRLPVRSSCSAWRRALPAGLSVSLLPRPIWRPRRKWPTGCCQNDRRMASAALPNCGSGIASAAPCSCFMPSFPMRPCRADPLARARSTCEIRRMG